MLCVQTSSGIRWEVPRCSCLKWPSWWFTKLGVSYSRDTRFDDTDGQKKVYTEFHGFIQYLPNPSSTQKWYMEVPFVSVDHTWTVSIVYRRRPSTSTSINTGTPKCILTHGDEKWHHHLSIGSLWSRSDEHSDTHIWVWLLGTKVL